MEPLRRREFLGMGLWVVAGTAAASAAGTRLFADAAFAATTADKKGPGVGRGTPKRGGALRLATSADVSSLDPTSANWTPTGEVYGNTIYDPLAALGTDGVLYPYLAESISPNPDYTEWTITVRPNVVFHDGAPLTGDAVRTNFLARLASPTGKEAFSNVASVTTSGQRSAVVLLHDPQVAFPAILTTQSGYMVAPSAIANGTAAHQPVGTGPFVFEQWMPNDHLTASRNPHYWRAGLPYLDHVTILPIGSDVSRVDSLLSGTVDMIDSTDSGVLAELRNNSSVVVLDDLNVSIIEPNVAYVALNTATGPTADLRVRQALAYATDASRVAKLVYNGMPVASGPFFPGSQYHAPTGYPTYNPARAKRLISAHEKEHGPVNLRFITTTESQPVQLAQVLQAMWKAVGISSQIVEQEQAAYIVNLFEGKYDAAWFASFQAVDPDLNYYFWSPTTAAPVGSLAINFTRNDDPKIQTALLTGRSNAKPAVRQAAYKQVARRLGADVPYLWLCRNVNIAAAHKNVQNFAGGSLPSGKRRFLVPTWTAPGEIWMT